MLTLTTNSNAMSKNTPQILSASNNSSVGTQTGYPEIGETNVSIR